ncbi:hypothetical protein [Pseudomonas sp. Ga0074129]|uniref:hypothetical protein n=1 Tax=Pseudomonas sp. Ga0074129 TaxID=1752219 RepID=UPI0025E5EA3C|nr:hypothetical protein [Pseudomonas sp. Ga0074129]
MEKILEVIAGGFAGALAAYLFNLLHWNQTEKRRKTEIICSNILSITDKIEDQAITYWLSVDNSRSPENKKIEISIKSLFRTQAKLIQQTSNNPNIDTQRKEKIKTTHDMLFEIATGDYFESRAKEASPSKCYKISQLSAEMRIALTEQISL